MAVGEFERAAASLGAETTVRGLLGAACRELVGLLDASACAVSRVIGDLLISLDEHSLNGRPLGQAHEYLISDFPLTQEVVESGQPRWVSRLDERPDRNEAALLEKLGFQSLLMLCLPAEGRCWGLVEVYAEAGRFDENDAQLAGRLVSHVGALLERLQPPEAR